MEYAGLKIAVNLYIASVFSRQMMNRNAGPVSVLDCMGGKRSFRCHLLNIAQLYKQFGS